MAPRGKALPGPTAPASILTCPGICNAAVHGKDQTGGQSRHCGAIQLEVRINEEPASPYAKQQRKSQIARMTRELQQHPKVSLLEDKAGTLLTEPTSIAKALQDHWSNSMTEGPKTVEEGSVFLHLLPLPRTLSNRALRVAATPLHMPCRDSPGKHETRLRPGR